MERNDQDHNACQPIKADLLDRPIAFHRSFVALTGSVNAALMLSQAVYWSKRTKDPGGWIYKTADDWELETGLTRREQETARAKLRDFVETKLAGVPAKLHYRVDWQAINDQFLNPASGYNERRRARETRFDKSAKLGPSDSPNAPSQFHQKRQTISSTTHGTTDSLPLAGIDPPSTRRRPGGEADVVAYCVSIGLTEDDGIYYHAKWLGTGFRNGNHDIKDWKETIRSAKAGGYAPSQRRGTKRYETTKDDRASANRRGDQRSDGAGEAEGRGSGLPRI